MTNKVIFYSGDLEIGKNERNLLVKKTKKGLKIEIYSCDWGTPNIVIFVLENSNININTDFNNWEDWLLEMISESQKPYEAQTSHALNIYRKGPC